MRLKGSRAAALVAGMLFVATAPALAANPKFMTDWDAVPGWASGPLEDVVRWEIMTGYPVRGKPAYWGELRPQDTVTRAEFGAMLARALDEHGTGALRPGQPITRAELATWVGRAAVRENVGATRPEPGFTDLDGEGNRDDILRAARAGIVRGYEDHTFRPAAAATRAEAAVVIHRLVTQLTSNPPDIGHLQRLYAEGMAVTTWAERQRDPRLATGEGLAPHLERYGSPLLFAADVAGQGFFLGNPVWYSEKRHIEERPVFLGKTVAVTVGAQMHRTRLDNGAWEVGRGWSARGHYLWWRRIDGRWMLADVRLYHTTAPAATWELPPFYDPAAYNPPRPKPEGTGAWWGEDGVLVYDPGEDPPETALFGMTNADGLVKRWDLPAP